MKKRCLVGVFLCLMMVCPVVVPFVQSASSSPSSGTHRMDGWYYLPAYPNYAPQGLPDFDQKQDGWKQTHGKWWVIGGLWSFCAPTSLADILWWFDSMHENASGYPGDGVDSYPLVPDFSAPGSPTPGPKSDDHNFNNVNDLSTPWDNGHGHKELIETLAWYCNTNLCQDPFIPGFAGTRSYDLENGTLQWLKDTGLQGHYTIEVIRQPDFSVLVDRLQNNCGIILNLLMYNKHALVFKTFLGHYVAVAGINPSGFIALSDPIQNKANPGPSPVDHNDANAVSHDIYAVNFSSPVPGKARWWIKSYFDFGPWTFGGLDQYALIIKNID